MPDFVYLSDAEIAALVNYTRQELLGEKQLPSVTTEMVTAIR